MSPTLLVILVAGVVFFAFLVLAMIVWSIRIRRNEEGFPPAPANLKKHVRSLPYSIESEQAVAEWMSKPTKEAAESIVPTGKLIPDEDFGSPFKNLLRSAMPELSTLIELGKLAQNSQSIGETPKSAEERNAALQNAIGEMLEKQPDNTFLHQILASLRSTGNQPAESADDDRIEVFLKGDKLNVRVDGIEYSDPEAISDPEMREKVRRVLESLDHESLS